MKLHAQSVDQILKDFGTDEQLGLSREQAHGRLQKDGPNVLPEGTKVTWFSIFISQFMSPLIYVLIAAAVIIFFVGDEPLDAFIITGVLFFNAIIGTIQEGRTRNIIESLKRFIKTKTAVIRDGKHLIIEDSEIVVGDIMLLQEGARVAADARIISSLDMHINQAVLTGESEPVHKSPEPVAEDADLIAQTNMIFRGTHVLTGTGKAVVVRTGTDTEIGKIHRSVEEIKSEIPLKKELNRLSYWILLFISAVCGLLLVIGVFAGRGLQEMLVMLAALFICVIPEGLPVVLTLVLVSGAYRMAKQNVLAKNLQGVEGLGRTNVIVSDKTGTITRNEMMVNSVYTGGNRYRVSGAGYYNEGEVFAKDHPIRSFEEHKKLLEVGIVASLLNTAEISFNSRLKLFDIKGDPTEAALYVFSQKLDIEKDELERAYKKQLEIPFSSMYRYHVAFYAKDQKLLAYVIGAPEVVLGLCKPETQQVKDELSTMLEHGLRVVALAKKEMDIGQMPLGQHDDPEVQKEWKALIEKELQFLGFCGIQDSIRSGMREIVEQARSAGLQIVMATGDHLQTAEHVAKAVGIFRAGDEIIEGKELIALSEKEYDARLDKITVYARLNPESKVQIIKGFHRQNKLVAMTGDGVNDVPSLVAADVGIAMGSIGTEVAKQAADLVLLDDSLESIINAIRQGRHVFYTLRRVVLYFFSTNLAEILIVLFALFTNLPLPLLPAQILWLNFVTDGFLDVGLSMEPQEHGLLSKSWLERRLQLVDSHLLGKMVYMALPMGIGALGVFWYYLTVLGVSLTHARTMGLLTLVMFQWFNTWNCRSETRSIFEIGILSNRGLIVAAVFVFLLQLPLQYTPFMQSLFKTVPLSLGDWMVVLAVSAPIVIIEELRKAIAPRLGVNQ